MRFSILIPVYNGEKYITDCIQSIVSQDYNDYEIIIIDDGSYDNSASICDRYQKEYSGLIKVFHKANQGLLSARLDAFSKANGDYCICVDADDFLEKDALTVLSSIIDTHHPDFILYDLIDYSGPESIHRHKGKKILQPDCLYEDLQILKDTLLDLSYCNWSMCAKCIKAEYVKDLDCIRNYYSISFGEDTLQTIMLYNKMSNFVYIDKDIYYYRVFNGMTNRLPLKHLEDYKKITSVMRDECTLWNNDIELSIDTYYSKIIVSHLKNILKTSETYKEYNHRVLEFEKYLQINETFRKLKGNLRSREKVYFLFAKKRKHRMAYIYFNVEKAIKKVIER